MRLEADFRSLATSGLCTMLRRALEDSGWHGASQKLGRPGESSESLVQAIVAHMPHSVQFWFSCTHDKDPRGRLGAR